MQDQANLGLHLAWQEKALECLFYIGFSRQSMSIPSWEEVVAYDHLIEGWILRIGPLISDFTFIILTVENPYANTSYLVYFL